MSTRRTFLKTASGALAPAFLSGTNVSERFQVAMMGFRGRGRQLLYGFAELPEVRVKTICDVDQRLFEDAVSAVDERQDHRPAVETDFRRLLDDPDIDVIVMGTPTHWHAIPDDPGLPGRQACLRRKASRPQYR